MNLTLIKTAIATSTAISAIAQEKGGTPTITRKAGLWVLVLVNNKRGANPVIAKGENKDVFLVNIRHVTIAAPKRKYKKSKTSTIASIKSVNRDLDGHVQRYVEQILGTTVGNKAGQVSLDRNLRLKGNKLVKTHSNGSVSNVFSDGRRYTKNEMIAMISNRLQETTARRQIKMINLAGKISV
tara:strand:- start:5704 stop:6252 length:549 start_codon:yes stop_codon:yes gene_type:complete